MPEAQEIFGLLENNSDYIIKKVIAKNRTILDVGCATGDSFIIYHS